jgi:tetratricopeptide (TPR) repeat protein
MLSDDEKQYLTWLTTEKYEGWGAIVELGAWLGSSSIALAEGLRRRGSSAKIQTFDLFRWEEYMQTAEPGSNLSVGDDFLPLYRRKIGEYAPWIEAHKQDLMNYSWEGGPIEILFVDSAKTWDLINAVLKGYGKHLAPERSRVVLQDFRYHYAHCLPLIFDSRPDLWKEVEQVDSGCTVTFMPLKPLDGPAGIHHDYSEDAFPFASAEPLLQSRIAREVPEGRSMIRQTLYRKCLIDGPLEEAFRLREAIVAEGATPAEMAIMEDVEFIVHTRGWKAYEQGDYAKAKGLAERCLAIARTRSPYYLSQLGFSLFRLGEREHAKALMEEVLSLLPGYAPAKLFRVELAIAEGRYGDWRDAIEVLRASQGDEVTIAWSLNLLTQAWELEAARQPHADLLESLVGQAGSLSGNPTFLAHLAREQFRARRTKEARSNLAKALALAPGHELATRLRAELGC